MPQDSKELRSSLAHLFPTLLIDEVAQPSGQRVVYFCRLAEPIFAPNQRIVLDGSARVVMKVCAGADPTTIAYMQMESEVLNDLKSSYFPRLLWSDVFNDDPVTDQKLPERLYISVEEYIESVPLSKCADQFRSEPRVIQLLIALVDGASLLWTHNRKLVHRDLKPQNILIRPSGDPVIIDLGILRESGAKGLTATNFWGPMTIHYASPEQAKYDKLAISFKSDIFSLSTIAYELLSSRNPYVTSSPDAAHEILENILRLEPPALSSLGVASEAFSRVIQRMSAKQPYMRYRTSAVLRDDLSQILNGLER